MHRRMLILGFIVGLVASFFVATSSTPAQSALPVASPAVQSAPSVALGSGCSAGLCGTIYNVGTAGPGGTGEAIYISRDRGTAQNVPIGPYAYIHGGQSSKSLWPDTDAFYVPPLRDMKCGYYTAYGWLSGGTRTATGWYAIHDGEGLNCWLVQ